MVNILDGLEACQPAIDWCEGKTAEEAWAVCERGDWMFWLCAKATAGDRRRLVSCACDCLRAAMQEISGKDCSRPWHNLGVVERWLSSQQVAVEMRGELCEAFDSSVDIMGFSPALLATTPDSELVFHAASFVTIAGVEMSRGSLTLESSMARLAVIVRKHYPVWPLA